MYVHTVLRQKVQETWLDTRYICKIAKSLKLDIVLFDLWKSYILEEFYSRLTNIQDRNLHSSLQILEQFHLDGTAKNRLIFLKNNFIFTSIDKAGQNTAIICKQFYALQLMKELNNPAYKRIFNSIDTNIIDDQRNYCLTINKFTTQELNKKFSLPYLYLIPKFHKSPIKFRPIVSCINCKMYIL